MARYVLGAKDGCLRLKLGENTSFLSGRNDSDWAGCLLFREAQYILRLSLLGRVLAL